MNTRRAVIFDLDGTLTLPTLDFDRIRKQIGISEGPVLEALEQMHPAKRIAAQAVLAEHERRAAEQATLQPAAAETVADLRARRFAVGILTRNARKWTELILNKFSLEVDAVRCREDPGLKPAPDGVLELCRQFSVAPDSCGVVGDYLFDIEAGRRAGAKTVLMLGHRQPPDYADLADHIIDSLDELIALVDPADALVRPPQNP